MLKDFSGADGAKRCGQAEDGTLHSRDARVNGEGFGASGRVEIGGNSMRCKSDAHHQVSGILNRPAVGSAATNGASPRARRQIVRVALFLATAIATSACGSGPQFTQTIKHGHQFRENDIAQIQPGMSQDQVKLTLGTPATTATVGTGNAYYYISSTAEQVVFLTPKEVDRQVVAVYFNPLGSVERVANYGIKDGKVFDFVTRTTPAPGAGDEGLLKSLFRNLGKKQLFGE